MKPTRNNVFCKESMRTKILFENQKKADNFIKFNAEDIAQESGYKPIRSYYCEFCAGWHVTSKKENSHIISRTEKVLDYYHLDNERRKIVNQRNKEVRALNAPEEKRHFEIIQNQIDAINEFLTKGSDDHDDEYYFDCLNMAYSSLKIVRQFAGKDKKKNIIEEKLNKLRKLLKQKS